MTYTLVAPDAFVRRFQRFLKKHPDLETTVFDVLRRLEVDPFDPKLHTHSLSGELKGYWGVRITYAYRLVVTIEISEEEIILLDIGSHDDVYR